VNLKRTFSVLGLVSVISAGAVGAVHYFRPGYLWPVPGHDKVSVPFIESREQPEEISPDAAREAVRLREEGSRLISSGQYQESIRLFQELRNRFGDKKASDQLDDFGYQAAEGLALAECLQERGEDFRASSIQELRSLLKAAIVAKDRKELASYASCTFHIGVCASDYSQVVNPQNGLSQDFFEFVEREGEPSLSATDSHDPSAPTYLTPDGHQLEFLFSQDGPNFKWVGLCVDLVLFESQSWLKQ